MTVGARHWHREAELAVCTLCPHACRLAAGEVGACGVRRNDGGELVTEAYALTVAAHASTIERKFLYHFRPGAQAYSLAAPGCNLRCRYCQNHLISQMPKGDRPQLEGQYLPADHAVAFALYHDCEVVAATYTEPTIFFEYALDLAQAARTQGLRSVWKTNGSISPAAQDEVMPWLDAVNVDLKSFRDETYRSLCGGRLQPVLDALVRFREAGLWVEVTTLVIPGLTDDAAELTAIGEFIRDALGPDTPWHLTRFHPDYELRDLPPTPKATLHEARARAQAQGLRYVYTDAEPAGAGWDTRCHACGHVVIERVQYALQTNHLRDEACPACGEGIPGVW